MFAFIRYPDWIKPEIIPGLPVRWYGLMYIVAFAVAYFILIYQVKRDKTQYPKELVDGHFFDADLSRQLFRLRTELLAAAVADFLAVFRWKICRFAGNELPRRRCWFGGRNCDLLPSKKAFIP